MQPDASVADYRLFQQAHRHGRMVVVQPAAYVHRQCGHARCARAGRAAGTRRRGGPSGGRPTADLGGWPTAASRHPLHPVRPRTGVDHRRHDRAAGQAGRAARLARANSPAGRTRSSTPPPSATAAGHRGVRSSRPASGGVTDPAMTVIRRMLDRGRTWMKLSGAYMIGTPPAYTEAGRPGTRLRRRRARARGVGQRLAASDRGRTKARRRRAARSALGWAADAATAADAFSSTIPPCSTGFESLSAWKWMVSRFGRSSTSRLS